MNTLLGRFRRFPRTWLFAGMVLALLICLPACKDERSAAAQEPAEKHADKEGHKEKDDHPDEIKLSADAMTRYGIKVEPAGNHVLTPTLVAPARVAFNAEAIAHVGSPLRGRAVDLKVKLGDSVMKGDVLLIVESPELGEAQSEYLQKRTAAHAGGPSVDLAKNAYDRAKALYEKSQGIALTEVQKREADYRAAMAALATAQTAVTAAENKLHLFGMDQKAVETLVASGEVDPRFAITTPIGGQVVEREVTRGELVNPDKDALVVVADLSTLWVLADVPESKLSEIAAGAKVRVTAGIGEGRVFDGVVAFISPAVDPATRSAQIRIEVRDGHLRPGMFVRVEIEANAGGEKPAPVLAVPDEAVQTVEGAPAVFVPVPNEANTFVKRRVRIGPVVGGMVPVLSGLKADEPVVVVGSFIMKAELGKGSADHD